MRKKITEKQIHAVYAYGLEVIRGNMTQENACTILKDEYDFDKSTARDYIYALKKMINGDIYKRGLNTDATRYYLEKIRKDFGEISFRKAISATRAYAEYYAKLRIGRLDSIEQLCDEYEKKIFLHTDLSQIIKTFEKAVAKSSEDTSAARKRRLANHSGMADRMNVNSFVFARNADVAAETLYRAQGVCEFCRKGAPFRKRDDEPYLEVHHRIPLKEGGLDTLDNTMALCPNCHREAHHGAEWEKFRIR